MGIFVYWRIVSATANVLRAGEVRPTLRQGEAPAVEQGYFLVPPVIEKPGE